MQTRRKDLVVKGFVIVALGLVALWAAVAVIVVVLAGRAKAGETEAIVSKPAFSLELIGDAWPTLPRVIGYEYNQKNHHDTPSFEGGSGTPIDDRATKRKKYRVIGITARSPETAPFEGKLVLRSHPQVDARRVKIPPLGETTTYLFIQECPDAQLRAELLDQKENVVATLAATLPENARTTPNRYDARFVAQELANEERVRLQYPSFPVSVRVLAEGDRPLSRARLTFHHEQFGMIREAEADDQGCWSGRLLAGAWTAIAFGAATEEGGASETTIVRTPRTLYLIKQFEATAAGANVNLKADQIARIRVRDETGAPLEVSRLTVAPHRIAEPLRFADVASRCAGAFILDIDMSARGGAIDLLTNRGATYDLFALARPAPGTTALLSLAGTQGDGEIALVFSPAKMARLVFDPPTGFGGGREIEARVTLLGAQRQSYFFTARELETVYFPAGKVRLESVYTTRNGDRVAFIPRRIDGKPGAIHDATPRPPFTMNLFVKQQRGIQMWVALMDGAGQIAGAIQSDGDVVCWRGQEKLFEEKLASMSFGFPAGLEKLDLNEVALETRVRVGTEWLRGRPTIEPVRRFQMHGTWAVAPRVLEDHVDAFLQMVAKSCEAEKRFLGGPPGPVGMDFQVFLPPGVGGLGGGGMIALDLGQLLNFVDETDALPYAYCHELGHNVGFGHDPYMLLAPCGVEEGMYGTLGYRMVNGAALEQMFKYLEGKRCKDEGTWTLSGQVFGGIRQVFGPEVHRKMFEMQRAYEQGLRVAGLSSIERIATLYSLALEQNVAWIFRAYGWPVFDFRVAWGRSVALTQGRGIEAVNPDQMQVGAFRRWWVDGPIGDGEEGDTEWQAITWPTDFIALDMDRPASEGAQRYRLFNRLSVPQTTIASLVAASDCALEIRVNGHAVARLDASPQLAQPVHDELMLDRKKAFPVLLIGGENTIEVDALQPPGARGFILGIAGADGKQIQVSLKKEGPDADAEKPEEKKLRPTDPVLNAGFEEGAGRSFGAWIHGPIEGGLRAWADDTTPGGGKRCLRMEAADSGAGGVIQRVVVEPGAVYRVRAKIRAEKLDGEAYVSLFTGEINAPITKTEPLKPIPNRWTEIAGRFAAQKRRVVYICCYVKAKSGVVWFDDIELIREK